MKRHKIAKGRAADLPCLPDKRPRNRYWAGNDARLVLFVDPLLSGKFRDWVVMRSVGLDGDRKQTGPGF